MIIGKKGGPRDSDILSFSIITILKIIENTEDFFTCDFYVI